VDTWQGEEVVARERGFTFIEVIIAVMLLAAATGILIGLESSAVQRLIYDRNTQQAMLAARRIMSMIEINQDDLSIANQLQGPVLTVLNQLGAPNNGTEQERIALEALNASIMVEPWTPPGNNIEENSMNRITLSIAWGPTPDEAFTIVYFIPAEDPNAV
jgi:prepilin-type N-terminal cleavage/methylation domain-containing protein